MFNLNPKTWTTQVKAAVTLVVLAAGSMQVDEVKNYVTPLLSNHPKLTSAFEALLFLAGLLHDPTIYDLVSNALGINIRSVSSAPGEPASVGLDIKVTSANPTSTAETK